MTGLLNKLNQALCNINRFKFAITANQSYRHHQFVSSAVVAVTHVHICIVHIYLSALSWTIPSSNVHILNIVACTAIYTNSMAATHACHQGV